MVRGVVTHSKPSYNAVDGEKIAIIKISVTYSKKHLHDIFNAKVMHHVKFSLQIAVTALPF
jgi:hypothetical protein